MPDFKMFGDADPAAATEVGRMTQGIGFPLRLVDQTPGISLPNNPVKTLEFLGVSTALQQPPAVDTEINIAFGGAQANTQVSMSAGGVLTFLPGSEGLWEFVVLLSLRRPTNPSTSRTFFQLYINGVRALNPVAIELTDTATLVPFQFEFTNQIVAGDTYEMRFYNDSVGGDNNAQLVSTPSVLYSNAPSSSLRLLKFRDVY